MQNWGFYGSLDAMSGSCPLKAKKLLMELSAREAYTWLLFQKDKGEYQERLNEVMRIKNKVK